MCCGLRNAIIGLPTSGKRRYNMFANDKDCALQRNADYFIKCFCVRRIKCCFIHEPNAIYIQWTGPEPEMTMIILDIFPKVENWMFMFLFDRISAMRHGWCCEENEMIFFSTRQFSSHFAYGRRKVKKSPNPFIVSLWMENFDHFHFILFAS